MMKKILILLLSLATFSCATVKVSYDYDRQAELTNYKTYKLSDGTLNMGVQQLNRDRIIKAVENEMASKGFSKSENPDLLVDVTVAGVEKQTATATTTATGAYGYRGWRYGGGFATTQVNYDNYVEGTMVITFVDASEEKIVWQGRRTKTLNESAKQ